MGLFPRTRRAERASKPNSGQKNIPVKDYVLSGWAVVVMEVEFDFLGHGVQIEVEMKAF